MVLVEVHMRAWVGAHRMELVDHKMVVEVHMRVRGLHSPRRVHRSWWMALNRKTMGLLV